MLVFKQKMQWNLEKKKISIIKERSSLICFVFVVESMSFAD